MYLCCNTGILRCLGCNTEILRLVCSGNTEILRLVCCGNTEVLRIFVLYQNILFYMLDIEGHKFYKNMARYLDVLLLDILLLLISQAKAKAILCIHLCIHRRIWIWIGSTPAENSYKIRKK